MKTYLYYPGCSLQGTAMEYDCSTRALMAALGAELTELPDWTCCGASAAESVGFWLSHALPARNLALAQSHNPNADLLVPCSACYLNLKKTAEILRQKDAAAKLNAILGAEGLQTDGKTLVRHLLDVLATDAGAAEIAARVERPLRGLKVAPYYGCQCLRPYAVFDDPDDPRSMEPLLESAGASIFRWDMGAACCGASLVTTKPEVGLHHVTGILEAARGADAVATVCPMCQMNLEAFQAKLSRRARANLRIPVFYLPQLLGLALGLPAEALGIEKNLSVTADFLRSMRTGSLFPDNPTEDEVSSLHSMNAVKAQGSQ